MPEVPGITLRNISKEEISEARKANVIKPVS